VVPFVAGGGGDFIARAWSDKFSETLKQPVIIENRGGGNTVVGTELVAKAAPDGYTLLLVSPTISTNPTLLPNLPYKTPEAFAPVGQVITYAMGVAVNSGLPINNVAELVAFAKKNPGKLDYGFTHAASGHMAMELFKQTTGIFLTGIPYRGGGPLLNDLLAGTVPMIFINQDAALPHIRAGKIRPIAVSSLQRNPLYPDVPTVAESGYKDFQALSWSGLSVTKGTPPAIVEKLEAAMVQALQSDALRQRLTSVGFVIPTLGGKAYTSFVKSEIDTWSRVIKTAGIKSE
jgi:tripartite-type tricarboxylate transporter receptor subunit TctC